MRRRQPFAGAGLCAAALLLTGLAGYGQKNAAPAPLPAGVAEARLDNITGGTKSLADFKGKITLVTIVGKSSTTGDAAGKIANEMGCVFASRTDFTHIMVVELTGFPSLMHNFVHNHARAQYDKDEAGFVQQFKQRGLYFEPRHHGVLLLDFDGTLGEKLGISDTVEEKFELYILDKQGRVLTHLTQGQNGMTEAKALELTQQALRKAFNMKK